jgi:acylphosphatase
MKAVRITVSGRVQGVTFRATARKKATELGVTGVVRNEANGSVFIEAEGSTAAVDSFIGWCHHGPGYAEVTAVDVVTTHPSGYKTFEITH